MKTLKEFMNEEFDKSIKALKNQISKTKDSNDKKDFGVVLKAIQDSDFKAAEKKISNMHGGPGDMIMKLVVKADGKDTAKKIFGKVFNDLGESMNEANSSGDLKDLLKSKFGVAIEVSSKLGGEISFKLKGGFDAVQKVPAITKELNSNGYKVINARGPNMVVRL